MSEWTVRNGRDAWVKSTSPSMPSTGSNKMFRVLNPGAATEYTYMWFRDPAPKGSTITSAQLHLFGVGADGVSATITVQRLSQKWSESQVNWNNKPAVTGPTVSLTQTQSVDGKEWVLDISALLQTMTDTGVNYGLRISTTATSERKFYSLNATDNRPFVVVQWSDAPDAPINLAPSGGSAVSTAKPTVSYDYYDPNGSDLVSQQIQINGTNAFGAPAFDSGVLATDDPELDLTTTAYAGIANAGTAWWRVKVQNGAGKWSDWSDATSFTRVDKVTVTLDNPAVSPNNFVSDPTPEFAWTVSGGSQVARRVIIRDLADPATNLLDTGRIHTTATTYTPPAGVITDEAAAYEIDLRVHDLDTRTATPNDTVYIQTIRQFTFVEDATIDPVTSFAVAQVASGRPAANLTWNRATFPDGYDIIRNGKVIAYNLDPADLFVSGTSSAYVDHAAAPNVDYTYRVRPRVNGKLGPGPTVAFSYQVDEIWLTDVDTGKQVPLLITDQNSPPTFTKPDVTGAFRPVGGNHVVRIWQGQYGPEGDVEGLLVDYAGGTAAFWLDALMWMKVRPSNKLRMVLGGRNLNVTLSNLTDGPVPGGKADWRTVSFHFESYDGPTA